MTDARIHGPIGEAYAAYDSDPRVSGPDDFEAFADAVESLRWRELEDLMVDAQLNRDELRGGEFDENAIFWDRLARVVHERLKQLGVG